MIALNMKVAITILNMKGLMITVIIMTMSMCMSAMKEIILQYALLIVLVWLVANVEMQVCKSS
jgi:hypothetical protein